MVAPVRYCVWVFDWWANTDRISTSWLNEGNVLLGCMLVILACSCHSRSDSLMVAVLVGYCHSVLFVFTSTTVNPCCLSMHCATLLDASPPTLSPCCPLMFFLVQSATPGEPTSESGETPLHKAVKRNHRHVAQLLIQNGECVSVHLCQPQWAPH